MKINPKSLMRTVHQHRATKYWESMDEMHRVMDTIEGHFKALLLELLEAPMSDRGLRDAMRRLETRMGMGHRRKPKDLDLGRDIAHAVEIGVLEEKGGEYHLTPKGREVAEHVQEVIPLFFDVVLSPSTASYATIIVHVLLSVLKLLFGIVSRSAGLIADGIDNTADTVSSIFVWIGLRFNKERMVSLFIVFMMGLSVIGVGIMSVRKILHPEPVQDGLVAFIVSIFCGIIMLVLSAYQFTVGRRNAHFAVLCQSIDSRNHFLTSLLVCIGIAFSFVAVHTGISWFLYADAAASAIIGLIILKSTVELVIQLAASGVEEGSVRHFMGKAMDKMKERLVFEWLSKQLVEGPLSGSMLEDRFKRDFYEDTPKILMLSGMGFRPESPKDIYLYLDRFTKKRSLRFDGNAYALRAG